MVWYQRMWCLLLGRTRPVTMFQDYFDLYHCILCAATRSYLRLVSVLYVLQPHVVVEGRLQLQPVSEVPTTLQLYQLRLPVHRATIFQQWDSDALK